MTLGPAATATVPSLMVPELQPSDRTRSIGTRETVWRGDGCSRLAGPARLLPVWQPSYRHGADRVNPADEPYETAPPFLLHPDGFGQNPNKGANPID